MDITVTGRGVGIPDRFEDYVTEKAAKVEALADRPLAFDAKVTRVRESERSATDRVELTLVGAGPVVRAEAEAADKYAAFDIAFDKLIERVRQARDRKKVHHGKRQPESLTRASAEGFADLAVTPAPVDVIERVSTGSVPIVDADSAPEDDSPVVIRRKLFPSERMTAESAVDRMELVGHDFFLFVDVATERPSVVYRRKGWNYGVIALDEEPADALATQRRRRAAR